ncbi:hypothetical protein F4808DRAFT_310456 [Astrocystis sublimbata]|nr:hypothetical protein F4808DRAFT_310456 [Astrocystis sublimbata]
MGLLTRFNKKSTTDLDGRNSLKACAYDAAVALEPPIRGTFPVLGNGSKILEQFQKSHPNLPTISHNSSPAPSPLVTRLRNDGADSSGGERPRTAPSSQPSGKTSPMSSQSQPVSGVSRPAPTKTKKYGPYRLPSKVATDIPLSPASAKPAPSPGLVSLYSDSLRSGHSSKPKGYVDLLDAQSRIKPADFYSRVEATGARNYGEDVADRNRQEKIEQPGTAVGQESFSDHGDARVSPIISKDIDDDTDDEPPRRHRAHHSIGAGLRSKHTSTHTLDPYPKRTSSRLPPLDMDETAKAMSRTASARSERAARRRSMPAYPARISDDRSRSLSSARRGKGKEPDVFPDSLRDRARTATMQEKEHTKPNISSKRQSLASTRGESQTRQKRSDLEKPLPAVPSPSKDRSKRKSLTHNSGLVESRLPAKRKSLQNVQPPSRGEFYEDTYQQKLSLQGTQLPKDRMTAPRRQLGSTSDFQDSFCKSPAQQPDHQTHLSSAPVEYTHVTAEPRQAKHVREQSMISLSNPNVTANEIDNNIPERGSSLGHWSLGSETALSTLSSNPFRPQSGHTTSTSIDYSPMLPLGHIDLLLPPVPKNDAPSKLAYSTPRKTRAKSSPSPPPTTLAHHPRPSEFHLEDHASYDGSTTPSSGSLEKELLFSEGDYGFSLPGNPNTGLPGLFDTALPVSSPSPILLPTTTTQVPELEPTGISGLLHFPAFPEIHASDEAEDDSFKGFEGHLVQADSSDDEMNFDIPMSRPRSIAPRHTLPEDRIPERRRPLRDEDGGVKDFIGIHPDSRRGRPLH